MAGDRKRTDGIYAAVEAASCAAEAVLHMRHSHFFVCRPKKQKAVVHALCGRNLGIFCAENT